MQQRLEWCHKDLSDASVWASDAPESTEQPHQSSFHPQDPSRMIQYFWPAHLLNYMCLWFSGVLLINQIAGLKMSSMAFHSGPPTWWIVQKEIPKIKKWSITTRKATNKANSGLRSHGVFMFVQLQEDATQCWGGWMRVKHHFSPR